MHVTVSTKSDAWDAMSSTVAQYSKGERLKQRPRTQTHIMPKGLHVAGLRELLIFSNIILYYLKVHAMLQDDAFGKKKSIA